MNTMVLKKDEYKKLKRDSVAYRKLKAEFFELLLKDPIEKVVDNFRKTKLYSNEFIKDLEGGLRNSSYGN